MPQLTEIILETPEDTEQAGWRLANRLRPGDSIYLDGDLGAGKTTLVRGLLHRLGHVGAVKSPTYTLMEQYVMKDLEVCHFDLYRIADPEELEFAGIRDYIGSSTVNLIEWSVKGAGFLPAPDVQIDLEATGKARRLVARACTPRGQELLSDL
ncbi:MAG: tRNA (adenosine(37)-N6)-threonylcarbamoyltransferase complex ATPase subunit type 1 TsaE [Gammaproteobacteria bacterium]|nr:MAG: tRNA (adenosine(37)-N6)-threonylcarbamoyltransferase complex ATPase subunit type 1 TsaE [Gammaproteobacteria bacterium]